MKLSEIKQQLQNLTSIGFILPNGEAVPSHFHVTEVGLVSKNFIDCGGKLRSENKINFQLWYTHDVNHQLAPQKLLEIIAIAEKTLQLPDLEVEVEYQNETIGKYDISFNGTHFLLQNTKTACLAEDQCGIAPITKTESKPNQNSCTPGGGCC